MKQTKFERGYVVTTAEALAAIEEGRWLYLRDKPMHPAFLMSMRLKTFLEFARGGQIFHAISRTTGR